MSEWPEWERFEHAGYTVRIMYDDNPGNPYKEWDQGSKLLISPALAREYDLGETFSRFEEFSSLAAATRYLTMVEGYLVAIPFRFEDYGSGGSRVYLTDTDNDRAAGFAVVSQETLDLVGCPPEDAEKLAREDFIPFAAYIEGDVFGWVVEDAEGRHVDSCWGYYGHQELDFIRQEGRDSAEAAREEAAERWQAEVVAWATAHRAEVRTC